MISDVTLPSRANGAVPTAQPAASDAYAPYRQEPEFSSDQAPVQISSIIPAIRRRWKVAFPIGLLLASVVAFAGWRLMLPKYRANAFLRIDSSDRPLIFETADQVNASMANFSLYKNTQKQLMVAPFVLNAALRDDTASRISMIQSESDPAQWLEENLQVAFPGDGEIMQVSLESEAAGDCVVLLNAVVNAFMEEVVVDERNERLQRLDNLERVYSEAEGKVRNKRAELKTLASSLGTGDSESLTVAQQSALQQYGLMREKLSEVQFRLMEAEGELRATQELMKLAQASEKDHDQERQAERNAAVQQLEERSLKLEESVVAVRARMETARRSFGNAHPNVQTIQKELTLRQDLFDQHRERMAIQKEKMHEAEAIRKTDASQYNIVAQETNVQILREHEKKLQETVNRLENETKQLGRSSIDIELMRSEIEGLEGVLHRVGEEIERTSIELKDASRIRLISAAESASLPDGKKRLALSGTLAMGAFFAPLALLVGWDISRKRVDDLNSVRASLPLATLGTIPIVSRRALRKQRLIAPAGSPTDQSLLTESVDSLASMIKHHAESEQRKVFMISSAVEQEGKTTIACQLAASISRSGTSVALVDFDLRRPGVHERFGIDRSPGVAEILSGETDWQSTMHQQDDLGVIVAGKFTGNLHERSTCGVLTEFFAELRQEFDMVIVDSPPVLPVADSRVIGTYCDGVIMTLIRDVSRLPLAAEACDILRSYQVNVVGTVVIGVGRSMRYRYQS